VKKRDNFIRQGGDGTRKRKEEGGVARKKPELAIITNKMIGGRQINVISTGSKGLVFTSVEKE